MLGLSDPELSLAIKDYESQLHPLAMRLQGRDGADYDDLMQEGRIAIWQAKLAGKEVNMGIVFKRMLNWLRHIRPQGPAPYDEILPLLDA